MKNLLILGAGKVGSLIATLLSHSGDYRVYLADSKADEAQRLVQELPHPNLKAKIGRAHV